MIIDYKIGAHKLSFVLSIRNLFQQGICLHQDLLYFLQPNDQYFIIYFLNKMYQSPSPQQQLSRAQRFQKQQYYKSLLDEQVKFKQESRKQYFSHQHRHSFVHHHDLYPSLEPKYQVEERNAGREELFPYFRSQKYRTEEEERTEQQIHTCQQIIRNLKELKLKQKRHLQNSRERNNPELEPIKSPKNPNPFRPQFQYYPKNNYFSNMLYLQSDPSRHKFSTSRKQHQTIEDNHSQRELPSSMRRKSKILPIKRSGKVTFADTKEQSSRKNGQESSHPNGLRRKSRLRQIKSNSKEKEGERDNEKKGRERGDNLKQLYKIRGQLTECLNELNNYLEQKNKKPNLDNQMKVSFVTLQKEEQALNREKERNFKEETIKKLKQIKNKSKELESKIKQGQENQSIIVVQRQQRKEEKEICIEPREKEDWNKIQAKTEKQKQNIEDNSLSRYTSQDTTDKNILQNKEKGQQSREIDNQTSYSQKLIDSVINHLHRQEQNNQGLASCLKELSVYLQKQQKKSKREDNPQFYLQGDYSREGNIQMKEEVVKRLKKARIRGSLLSEKIKGHNRHFKTQLKEGNGESETQPTLA